MRVWQDSIDLYVLTCKIFRSLPFELKKVASQAIASSDSIHRNIAEGYCRRSLSEYLNFLNYALGSAGECVSGYFAYRKADQISEADFQTLNTLAFKLENGLLKLVESLEHKKLSKDWNDDNVVRESNAAYTTQSPISPLPHLPISS